MSSSLTSSLLHPSNSTADTSSPLQQQQLTRHRRKSSLQLQPSAIPSPCHSDQISVSTPKTPYKNDPDAHSRKLQSKKREVYRFQTNWLVSSLAWSNEPGESFHLALTSYIEEYTNWVQLVSLNKDEYGEEIESFSTFKHPYPATKILWIPRPPESKINLPQLLATTADYLRLWRFESPPGTRLNSCEPDACSNGTSSELHGGGEVKLECLLNPNKGLNHCAPLTSFDWNEIDPSIIVTSSVDTTCAIWDIEACKLVDRTVGNLSSLSSITSDGISCNLRSQIFAHNHEVYDVSFSRSGSGRDVFVSVGGDGSVRLFDLRRLSASTMLYEAPRGIPSSESGTLVRVCCNKQDANYVAAFGLSSKNIIILDLRSTGRPAAVLGSHLDELNSISWAPHSAHHICSAADDHQALIWELSKLPEPINEPLLAYRATGKINVINWSTSNPDWIAIGFQNYLELLRV